MSDITMCDDHACPLAAKCFRYTAPACPYRQARFIDSPREGERCGMFWNNEGWGKPQRLPMGAPGALPQSPEPSQGQQDTLPSQ